MTKTERQQYIGRMTLQILDLYSEGKVPLPPADVIRLEAADSCNRSGATAATDVIGHTVALMLDLYSEGILT